MIATSKVEVHPEGDSRPDLLHVDISPPQVRVVNAGDSIVLDCVVHGQLGGEGTKKGETIKLDNLGPINGQTGQLRANNG